MQCFHAKNITASLSAAVHAGTCSCTGNTKKHILYTYAFPYLSSLPDGNTYAFPNASGLKDSNKYAFPRHFAIPWWKHTRFPICKGNTLKIGIIIVEVETQFKHIACFHATGCFECGNTCAFPWDFYFVMGNTCAFPWFFWFWMGNTCMVSTFGVLCAETRARVQIHVLHRFGKLLFLRSRVFCRCHDVAEKLSRCALKKCHGTHQSKSTE